MNFEAIAFSVGYQTTRKPHKFRGGYEPRFDARERGGQNNLRVRLSCIYVVFYLYKHKHRISVQTQKHDSTQLSNLIYGFLCGGGGRRPIWSRCEWKTSATKACALKKGDVLCLCVFLRVCVKAVVIVC